MEVANILRRRIVQHSLLLADATQVLSQFLSFPLSYPASNQLSLHTLALAAAYNLPAGYDAHCLALAEVVLSLLDR